MEMGEFGVIPDDRGFLLFFFAAFHIAGGGGHVSLNTSLLGDATLRSEANILSTFCSFQESNAIQPGHYLRNSAWALARLVCDQLGDSRLILVLGSK
jgi:hypothetical protein